VCAIDDDAAPAKPVKGIVLVVLATLAFGLADTATKELTARHPATIVMAVRYLVNLTLLTVFLGPSMGSRIWRVNRKGLVFLRAICLAVASLTMGLALSRMPLGETVAIIYLAPFAVMLIAIPLLGEKVRAAGWLGASLGFLGVILIVRPGGGLDPVGVAFAVANAALSTIYHLMTRLLSRTETTIPMLYQTALVGSVFFCVLSLGSLGDISIDSRDFLLMAVLGTLMTAGHFLFTAAYREAPASLLAPINYLHLVWAGGLGLLIFGHMPDALSLLGMGLVCVSGVVAALWAAPRKRVVPAPIE
jgi:drug/metabolite transporter (DMT)-like permease